MGDAESKAASVVGNFVDKPSDIADNSYGHKQCRVLYRDTLQSATS